MTPTVIAVIVIVVLALAFAIERSVAIHRKRATTGLEELIGNTATARTALSPAGQVFFRGERWEAISESGHIEANEQVIITKMKDLVLYVKKPDKQESPKSL